MFPLFFFKNFIIKNGYSNNDQKMPFLMSYIEFEFSSKRPGLRNFLSIVRNYFHFSM